jgi:PAS domain S-box-containing protein
LATTELAAAAQPPDRRRLLPARAFTVRLASVRRAPPPKAGVMPARVLIAEDDAILALRIQRTVEGMGYAAAGLAATGEDAVRLAEELRPDVVLMDVRLRGEMTGVQAAATIHARSDTPVIYVTAYSDTPLIEQATRTAPYAYLTKPIRDRELHASIEMALYKRRTDIALSHLNRVLRSIREVNQLITRERHPQRLMEQACQILLGTSGYSLVWIAQQETRPGGLETRAHAGTPGELLEWTRRPGEPEAEDETSFATVLRTKRPRVWRPLPEGLREVCGAGGSVAIVPMLHAERVYGCLCVYSTLREGFDEDEIGLLQELAGDLAFALSGVEDAARRERAEQALAESNENWHRLVEYQPTANVVHREGRILYANQACLRIAGVSGQEELMGRDILTFVHEDSRGVAATRLQALTEASSGETTELKLLRAGGEPVEVEMTSQPVTYLGRPAIQSVFWDVTERRRTEEQLRRAQKLDSVGRLAAGVAHDFNNRLQVILCQNEILMRQLHPSDARLEHAQEIMAAAQRCADLSRQLLAFSRRQVLDLRVVDLREVVRRMESLLRGTLREDVLLQVLVSEEPCLVKADVGQLEQILLNLAVNAQDAMSQGGTLKIEVAPSGMGEPPGSFGVGPGSVALTVSDSGCGMDAFTREHAFEPFFTSKEAGKGTGLGLAMVHGIVRQHGGSIQVESEVGAGTTFRICLPDSSESEIEPLTAPSAAGPTGNETVLVVEDTAAVLRVTVSALERHGYSVLSAESGRAGLALLERHEGRLDLLLTDLVMPDMNGQELAARVRARLPTVKVLFMSGHETSVLAAHGALDEGVLLIGKPFSIRELTTRVRSVLDGA